MGRHWWSTHTHTHTHHFSLHCLRCFLCVIITDEWGKSIIKCLFHYIMQKNKILLILYFNEQTHLVLSTAESDQIRSVAQSCPTLCDPMNRSMPGLPVHHQLPEFTQTQVHWVSDAIQPSHPLVSPSPPAPNPSQHQSLFQWVNSSHEVAKVLEFQL